MDYTHYGMHCSPFEQTANATFYYPSAVHHLAASAALSAVNHAPSAVVILGQTGMGKTILASHLLEQFHRDLRVTSICVGPHGLPSVSERLAAGLSLEAPAPTTQQRIAQVAQRIKSEAGKSTRFVALLDDAHHLSAENVGELEELMATVRRERAPLALVLLASGDLEVKLRDANAKMLMEILPAAIRLKPLDRVESEAYIRHRLRAAGNAKANLFSTEALSAIIASTNGVPSNINASCLAAMDNLAKNTSTAGQATPVSQVVTRHPVAEQLGAILESAPKKLAQLRTAVERLEHRAEAAVARTSERLAEVKDQSVRQMRDLPTNPIDTQQLIETTADADRMQRRLSEFCDRFAEVSATCEERLALLLSSLDAARQVHAKLERLSENVGELVDDAQQNASDERDRLKAMFNELQARREELTLLLDSSGKTHAAQIADANERTQSELKKIKTSVNDARDGWAQLKAQIEAEAGHSRQLISQIGDRLNEQERQLERIRDIEKQCADRAEATAGAMDALTANLGRASNMTAELEKLNREIDSSRQAAEQATSVLRAILVDAKDVQSQSMQSTTEAQKAAATITQVKDELSQNLGEAQRVADRLSNLEGDAAKRIDGIIGAAEARINQFVEQAVARIEHSIANANAVHENVSRKTQSAAAQIEEGVEQIRTARRNALESLEPIIAGASKGKREIEAALQSAQSALEHKKSVAAESLDAANQRAIQVMQQHSHTILDTLKKSGQSTANEIQQSCERSTLESLKRLSAAGGRQIAQISTHAEAAKKQIAEEVQTAASKLESTARQCEKGIVNKIGEANASGEKLTELNDTANRRCQEVILATKALAESLEQSQKCRDAVDHLIRDVWNMSTTAETRTRELVSLSEQALSRGESLRDAIAQSKAPVARLNEMILQAGRTADALAKQAHSTQKASLEFTRSIENAKRVNEDLKTMSESGAAIRDTLGQQSAALLEAIQTGEGIVRAIADEASTAEKTSHLVQELTDQASDAQKRLVEVQRELSGPLGVIRDAKTQAEELNGICLSVKRVFASVSQATLDANDRIKAMQTLLAQTQAAQTVLQQWVTEAIHTQVRLSSTVKGAPPLSPTSAAPQIPDATAQPVPDILKSTGDVASQRGVRIANPRKSSAGKNTPEQDKAQRLSPDQIRKMIADAQSKARDKELASLK